MSVSKFHETGAFALAAGCTLFAVLDGLNEEVSTLFILGAIIWGGAGLFLRQQRKAREFKEQYRGYQDL
jgi:hypothetical protein